MAVNIPPWLQGPGVKVLALQPITAISPAGVPTLGTSTPVLANFRDIRWNSRPSKRNIAPSSTRSGGSSIYEDASSWTVSEFVEDQFGATGAVPSALWDLFQNNDEFLATFTAGGCVGTLYCSRGEAEFAISKEESVVSITLDQIYVTGVLNPTWTSAL